MRTKILLGRSAINAGDIRALQHAWRERRVVVFLGAGVSVPCGLPSWRKLILDVLYSHSANAKRWRGLHPEDRRTLLVWLCEHLDQDPLVLARLAKKTVTSKKSATSAKAQRRSRDPGFFLETVRRHLYPPVRVRAAPGSSLGAVVDLLARGGRDRHVAAVVTFNFDDLLEQELRRRRVVHHVVTDGRRIQGPGVPILHPHGYLPRYGPLPAEGIVFSEDEYHRLVDSPFHWATTALLAHLRENTAILIGLSLGDPNLRRLLDASRYPGDRPRHFQIQRRYRLTDEERAAARDQIEKARQVRPRRGRSDLDVLLDATLRQAETHERIVSESLGVKTIWIEDFDDIPHFLGAISKGRA